MWFRCYGCVFFFFKQKTAYEMRISDWSSDVCSSDLRNRLWRAARVIIDVGMHTGAMTFDEGVKFLVEKVRFEPYAAELEVGMYARRPTYVLDRKSVV